MRKSTKVRILPSSEMVMGVLNGEKRVINEMIQFYDGYILAASMRPAYSAEGSQVGYYIDEDIAQNIRTDIFKCLPNLRKVVDVAINKKKNPVLVVVSDFPNIDTETGKE